MSSMQTGLYSHWGIMQLITSVFLVELLKDVQERLSLTESNFVGGYIHN